MPKASPSVGADHNEVRSPILCLFFNRIVNALTKHFDDDQLRIGFDSSLTRRSGTSCEYLLAFLSQCLFIVSERIWWLQGWCYIDYMDESKRRLLFLCQLYGFSKREVRGAASVIATRMRLYICKLPILTNPVADLP